MRWNLKEAGDNLPVRQTEITLGICRLGKVAWYEIGTVSLHLRLSTVKLRPCRALKKRHPKSDQGVYIK